MQQHPIPQDITGYRFHIIGSMTLKQFGEVFLGVIVAVVIYSTNLIIIVKWPLIMLSVTMGIVAAFVPIQERPLSHWISTFIKIMYRPTKFFWERNTEVPEVFLFESTVSTVVLEPEIDLTPAKRQRIKEYLGSVPGDNSFSTDFSQDEIFKMQNILASFDTTKISTSQIKPINPKKIKPNLDIRVRSMRMPKTTENYAVFENEHSSPEPAIVPKIEIEKEIDRKVRKTILSSDQVAHKIQVPKKTTIKLKTEGEAKEKQVLSASTSDMSEKTFIENQDPLLKKAGVAKDINFNANLPFPIKPTKPNKLVGMVLSQNNDLLTNSIVEVQTTEGHIERAVKTNALGQFFITTSLKNGEYNIIVEKDNYIFRPLYIKVDGSIIQPIEIRSEN